MRQPNATTRSVTRFPVSVRTQRRLRRLAGFASGVLVLSGCERAQPEPDPAPKEDTPTVVMATPALDRSALLVAIDQAASAFTAGTGQADASLAGRRFQVRQPMGCSAPVAASVNTPEGVAKVIAIDKSNDLRLTLTPADWTSEMDAVAGTDAWEAAEGFWLSWPWHRSDLCPRPVVPIVPPVSADISAEDEVEEGTEVSLAASPTVPSSQTAALVAVFEVDSSRLKRRMGRAYEFTLRGEGGTAPVVDPDGYRIVFEGRIAAFADGHSIKCHSQNSDQRPVCATAVHLERVAFETAKGQTLAEWRGG